MRGSRVKALEKPPPLVKFGPEPPLSLKQEAEPPLSKETNEPLSPEKEVIPDKDPELIKLKGLTNPMLNVIIKKLGGSTSNKGGGQKNKQTLIYGILELRKTKGDQFTKLLNKY